MDVEIDYDDGFKLFMTTRLGNPKFLPSVRAHARELLVGCDRPCTGLHSDERR